MTIYPDIEGPVIMGHGYVEDGIMGYVATSGERAPYAGYRVGAYYFGMFSPEAFESPGTFNAGEIYGPDRSMDWWAGVRDLFDNNLPDTLSEPYPVTVDWWAEDWSHMKPVIGYYDQSDPRTIRKHIRQAKSNGIDFFNFYWYWDLQSQSEILADGLNSFLDASEAEPFDFMIPAARPVTALENRTFFKLVGIVLEGPILHNS